MTSGDAYEHVPNIQRISKLSAALAGRWGWRKAAATAPLTEFRSRTVEAKEGRR
jgi:hypothetical protein